MISAQVDFFRFGDSDLDIAETVRRQLVHHKSDRCLSLVRCLMASTRNWPCSPPIFRSLAISDYNEP